MPLRRRLRRFRNRVSSQLDALLPTSGAICIRSSTSSPDMRASGDHPITSGYPTSIRSEIITPIASQGHAGQGHAGHYGNQASINSPTLLLPGTTGEITPMYRRVSTPSLGQAYPGSVSPHASTAATGPATALPAAATQSADAGSWGWTSLRSLLGVLDHHTSLFGPFKAVIAELVGCVELYERVANGRDEFKSLQKELEALFENLQWHFARDAPPVLTASMESFCKSILQELRYAKEKQSRGATKRYLDAGEDSENVLACYRRIQAHLERLLLNVNVALWKIVDEQATGARLDRLCPALSACYNSAQAMDLKRGVCTPGTRIDVLGQMHGWVHDRVAGSVYWLNGMAGTGKTTLAYSLCTELDAARQLGASFFCSRLLPECRDVNLIVPSIAYQLARFSRPFRYALSKVLEKEPDVHRQLLHIQFEALIVGPLANVQETLPENLVVVIDALDECDNKKSTGRILEALLTKSSNLPIKFFIATRPEPEIRDQMKKQGGRGIISRLVLHELDKGMVQGDIETYLRTALEPTKPSESDIAALVQRAGILFIYAATVARYIGHDNFGKNPRARLKNVLNASSGARKNPYKEIDELYTLILEAVIDDPDLDDEEKDDTKQVLYATLCAREPLTISALSGLLGLHDVERVHAALRPLWSVLHVVESSGMVTTLHASFPDYMFDSSRSKAYCCDFVAQDHVLARCCFDCIKDTRPQFNICGLESSFVPDQRVAGLNARVERAVSSELFYACQYWATHLQRTKGSSDIVKRLEDFLSARLLLWMEVMNLKKCTPHTRVRIMWQAEDWCIRQISSEELTRLAHDAWRFVTTFASSPVSESTAHIYVSMLPFWPGSSPLSRYYTKRMQEMIEPQGTALARRRLALLFTWPAHGKVTSIAWSPDGARIALVVEDQIFVWDSLTGQPILGPLNQKTHSVRSIGFSPDGTRIVSGSEDGAVRLWDAQNGDKILGPVKGHTDIVGSVAFSFDNTHIVSGSHDGTIRVCDARNGKKILGPLKGHTGPVMSVAFSPDSIRVASCSSDKTICVWDVRGGQKVLGPLEGHTNTIMSVAFSPDGTRIVSGSYDKTIRIWNAQTGKIMMSPLKGHTDWVTSVALSPDGTRIISGSDDNTIRMWDTQNGRMAMDPLEGHAGSIISAVYSFDGTRIASCSSDNTIRMWDTRSGQAVLDLLEGHVSTVSSVAFSPDGTRIVSGSYDKTIRLWDARSGRVVLKLGSVRGHTNTITSVAFSPDGTRIISGSRDKTIRIWDAQSGAMVLNPLEGHTNTVVSVAFSPDGTRIVSGSGDCTIRTWDTRSGEMALGPLEGHNSWVMSVAFSPDGTRIVSGSRDEAIRIWDAQSGDMVLGPLQGHTNSVMSVAFSPDGTCIASGSDDNTIRVWGAQTGEDILAPLKGHSDRVVSVAFSPDGTRLVSGSYDKTIRVWDIRRGKMDMYPLEGHINCVVSVAFSPDGTRIVSGSSDSSICIWDVRSRRAVVPLLTSSSTAPSLLEAKINGRGWLLDGQSRLLVWVPPDLRRNLLPRRNIHRISAKAEYVGLNFDNARIGASWTGCYQPE